MLDLLIKNGNVVFPKKGVKAVDIGVKNGKIHCLAEKGSNLKATKEIDISGLHVFPGVIDAHQHLGIYNEIGKDFADTKGHAIGGITTIVNYYREPQSYFNVIPRLIEEAEKNSYIDFAFSMGILTNQHIKELEGYIHEFGQTSFKFFRNYERRVRDVFKTDDGIDLSSADLVHILQRFKEISPKMLLSIHCENMDIQRRLTSELKKQDLPDNLETWSKTSPGYAEAESLLSTLYLNEQVEGNIFIVHLTSGESVDVLKKSPWLRERGVKVETCTHYLNLTTEAKCGLHAKIGPPIHHQWDQDQLWDGISSGIIQAIGTDHCPSTLSKKYGKGEGVWDALFAFPSAGTLLPSMITKGHFQYGLPLETIADITSCQLAESFNLTQKGDISVGKDADFAIVDLNKEQTVKPDLFFSECDYGVFEGMNFRGWPLHTLSRGEFLVKDGNPVMKEARGRYVKRSI
ncbi:amidohydrolase family protein [Fictibacillus enclensis]|uniref:dihydroorotase n=1 Tax=Fictibacillus enclensis TaxID=1017270 RepID=UPI0025A2C423|nr:amidohydrolase family protein [Fictibacillus enclensis]MDM5336622.1 amidohydrolase family protein [Fictibacillus enclensis]